jgi:hypothetical protein
MIWEINNPAIYLTPDRQKQLQQDKILRSKISSKVKLYEKVLSCIEKAKVEKDLVKLNAEHLKLVQYLEKEEKCKKEQIEKQQIEDNK